jgi:hypothetical protein
LCDAMKSTKKLLEIKPNFVVITQKSVTLTQMFCENYTKILRV